MDQGVVLIDPAKYWEFEEFAPTYSAGLSTAILNDIDGIPYCREMAPG